MANNYNPDNTETDYIDNTVAESQYDEDTKTHLRDVTDGINSQETDTTKKDDETTSEKTDETTTTETSELKNITSQYLNSSNMFVLIWFLTIYIVVYYVL